MSNNLFHTYIFYQN